MLPLELLNRVVQEDCVKYMERLEDNSIDSIATDPPYGLAFMGRRWDTFTPERYQRWCTIWGREALRVLKPGAYLIAFGGTRTAHRLVCGLEDAGFKIVDSIHWIFGSGFPKGQNISKKIDKKLGFEGTPVDKSDLPKRNRRKKHTDFRSGRFHRADGNHETMKHTTTLPESEEAKQWHGWNTHLKPAHEPIVLAQKPLDGTVIENVLKWEVGGLNIDDCRVVVNPDVDAIGKTTTRETRESETWRDGSGFKNEDNPNAGVLPSGRYPANLILSHHPDCNLIQEGETHVSLKPSDRTEPRLGKYGIYGSDMCEVVYYQDYDSESKPEIWECVDSCPVRMLNEQAGPREGCKPHHIKSDPSKTYEGWGSVTEKDKIIGYPDSSKNVARFFYCSKPSVSERTRGLEGDDRHITVKPIELMRWLIRLITPPEGVVLDMFIGSGTTGIAAEMEGHEWLGCDKSKKYVGIANKRIAAWRADRMG